MDWGPAYSSPLTEEQRDLVALVAGFAAKAVAPHAAAWDRADAYPDAMVEGMKRLGLFGMAVPARYGGLGLDHATACLLVEELSHAWISAAGAVNSHTTVAYALARFGTAEQQARWLPAMASGECRAAFALTEPDAGTDLRALRTVARPAPDGGWVLTGTKRFITNGRRSGLLLVLARTGPEQFGLFLVPQPGPGVRALSDWDKLGFRGIETCDLAFEAVPLPAVNLLGMASGAGWDQVIDALEAGRLAIAASAVGLARAAMTDAVAYVRVREAYGRKLSEHPAIRQQIAAMAARLNAARLLTLAAAAEKERSGASPAGSALAKVYATETAQEASLLALRLHGGYGYTSEYRAERYYRDAPAYLVGEGANEALLELAGRRLCAE
jgi:alkylation response protein AidB-like acyl-CoA dehydrogenase